MADEYQKAQLSRTRGNLAAGMKHDAAKKFIADSANIDTDYHRVSQDTADEISKQEMDTAIRSMKKGGIARKTGLYRLHKGERVVPRKSRKSRRG